MKKKILTLCLVIALAATAVIGGTLAYFTDTAAPIENVMTLGNVNIDLTENYPDDQVMIPGAKLTKEVFVENTGSLDAYARVLVAFQHTNDDHKGGMAAQMEITHTAGSLYEWYGPNDCVQLADGNYYSICTFTVNKVLTPNEKVATMGTVGFNEDVTMEDLIKWGVCTVDEDGNYQMEDIKIYVAAQAVQADEITADDKDTSGEGKGSDIDDILDLAFKHVDSYTAAELSDLFGIKAGN